jgi:hypothetical protein
MKWYSISPWPIRSDPEMPHASQHASTHAPEKPPSANKAVELWEANEVEVHSEAHLEDPIEKIVAVGAPEQLLKITTFVAKRLVLRPI